MKLYITTDYIGTQSGGGIVTEKELEAIRSVKFFGDDKDIIQLDAQSLLPTKFGLPDTPFLSDYLAMDIVSRLYTDTKITDTKITDTKITDTKITNKKIDLAHFYSGTFTQTIRLLHSKNVKVTYTCSAHDRKLSINEFEKLGYVYPYPHVKDDKLWSMYSGGVKEADIVIAPSKSSADFLYHEGCKKVEVIPHGCYIPEKIEPFPTRFDVGYLGQTGPDKGLIYIIQAWNTLNYKDSTLIFAGSQTELLPPFIRQHTNGGQYHIMGYVKEPSMLYNRCKIYVQPSVTEGFGIEVLEAMSHGRPVIVSDGAGAADLVTEGVDGFVVPKRDFKAMANKIDWFKNHPKDLIEMGENARKKSLSYSWDNIMCMYKNLWESLLGNDICHNGSVV